MKGIWQINIIPKTTQTETWNDVFRIEERYKTDYLEAFFKDWVSQFLQSMKSSNININTEEELITQLNKAADLFYKDKFNNLNLIRAPLFRFLGNGKLKEFYNGILLLLKERYAA